MTALSTYIYNEHIRNCWELARGCLTLARLSAVWEISIHSQKWVTNQSGGSFTKVGTAKALVPNRSRPRNGVTFSASHGNDNKSEHLENTATLMTHSHENILRIL